MRRTPRELRSRREEAAQLLWRREVGRAEHDLQHSAADQGRRPEPLLAPPPSRTTTRSHRRSREPRSSGNEQVPAAELNRLRLGTTADPHAERAIGVGQGNEASGGARRAGCGPGSRGTWPTMRPMGTRGRDHSDARRSPSSRRREAMTGSVIPRAPCVYADTAPAPPRSHSPAAPDRNGPGRWPAARSPAAPGRRPVGPPSRSDRRC